MNEYTIMIIDDEPWTLIWLQKLFDRPEEGFRVTAAERNPTAALAVIEANPPDVVITDIRMLEINGIELIRYLRDRGIDSKVAIVSGLTEFEYARDAIRYDVFDYLLKPVDEEQADVLLTHLMESFSCRESEPSESAQEEDEEDSAFSQMLAYIDKNYTSRLYLKDLAEAYHFNANYCCTLFQTQTGMTFSHYIISKRMEKASRLLETKDLSVGRIAELVGYNDYFYFNKLFKKKIGVTPAEFRRTRQGKTA